MDGVVPSRQRKKRELELTAFLPFLLFFLFFSFALVSPSLVSPTPVSLLLLAPRSPSPPITSLPPLLVVPSLSSSPRCPFTQLLLFASPHRLLHLTFLHRPQNHLYHPRRHSVLTGDELFTDAYDVVEVDDSCVEVNCDMITIKEGDVNIG